MLNHIKQRITSDMSSICFDGSSFDSTQFAPLMTSVDDKLFDVLQPYIQEILELNSFEQPASAASKLCKDAKSKDLFMFTRIDGINGPKFTTKMMKAFQSVKGNYKDPNPEVDWI